jgi:hypothetical protein
MKLLFLILAHDRPEQAAALARTLVAAGSDATALVHFDVRAGAAAFAALARAVEGEPRVRLVARRVAGRWGGFGLVEAPLNALAEAEAEGIEPDYVTLLSGACLPCRPVAALERFLEKNRGREFIEAEDSSWIGNGWRDERWQYRFWFDHKTQHPAEWAFFQIQRLLGLKRAFPEGLTPRFGSQWWTLSWPLCEAILADTRRSPKRLDFFRQVWIPDEMVFQSYAHALSRPGAIAGFSLTHFQFSNRGKPVVFHDDHTDYVLGLDRFFVRKAAGSAARLRAACLARAAAPAATAPGFAEVARRRTDYLARSLAQTRSHVAGQPFFRDQHVDMTESVLAAAPADPYLAVIGPPPLARALIARLPEPRFTRLGEIFAPDEVDFGPGRDALGGLRRSDRSIRDLHPAQFLVRVRARCDGVPAIAFSSVGQGRLLEAVLRDPRALKLACLPVGGDPEADALALALACRADPGQPPLVEVPMPGIPAPRALRAQVEAAAQAQGGWFEGLAEAVLGSPRRPEDRGLGQAVLLLPWQAAPDPLAARHGRALADEMAAACRFRRLPWFAAVADAARGLAAEIEGGLPPMLGPAADRFPEVFRKPEPEPEIFPSPALAGGRA